MKIAKNCQGLNKGCTVYALFNDSMSKVFDIELTTEQAKKLATRKNVTVVSWMDVWRNSNEKQSLGVFAQEVSTVKDLENV